jgi:hypothetical protein
MSFGNLNYQLPTVYPQMGGRYSPSRRSRSRSGSLSGANQWQGLVSQCSQTTGASASQCAHALSPSYRSRSRSPSPSRGMYTVPMTAPMSGSYSPRGRQYDDGRRFTVEQASTIQAMNASASPRSRTRSSSPDNRVRLNTDDYRNIARALGVSDQGDSRHVVNAIRDRVNGMSYQQRQSFTGSLTPRSYGTYSRMY